MTERRISYFIRLIFRYLSLNFNFQHFLYLLVFITFDLGDAITASMMMESKGISAEYNFIVRHIYYNFGLAGLISAKLIFIIIPLIIASSLEKRSYWMVNGILFSLITFGLLAVQANVKAMLGHPHMAPMEVNMIYLVVLFLFAFTGNIIDEHFSQKRFQKPFPDIE